MASGKRVDDSIREQAYALLALNKCTTDVAKELGLPRTTVATWQSEWAKAPEGDESELVKARRLNKIRFIDTAWQVIGKSLNALDVKLDGHADGSAPLKASELTNILGVVYDKQALACQEATQIIDGSFSVKKFEDF